MSEIINEIKNILEISKNERVVLFTNNLKIVGNVKLCDICNEGRFLNLTNATVILLSEIYDCESEDVCDEFVSQNFKWLHINSEKILAFSVVH